MAAESTVFTEEALNRLKGLIGVPLRKEQQYNEYATIDTIRHFAYGIGDTNPLYCDTEYGRKTGYGSIIAPPYFIFSCMCHPGAAHTGLPGAHSLRLSDDLEWFEVIREGDRIISEEKLLDLQPSHGRFASVTYDQYGETTFRNQRDELVARRVMRCRRYERASEEGKKKYSELTVQHYTPEMIKAIQADYDKEERRGPVPRYWEDVKEGDAMMHVVKGPLTITDLIVYKMGQGWNAFVRAHGIRLAYERRHPSSAIPNKYGIPDCPERVHWEDEFAQKVGIPAAFDFAHQRISWLAQVITNWMGDDGFLKKLYAEIRLPNLVGDTTWCRGKVTRKYIEGNLHIIDCDVWAQDQREAITASGNAKVILPSRG